jgi:cobalt-zinc-cadmium efflux system membrane fusion protein
MLKDTVIDTVSMSTVTNSAKFNAIIDFNTDRVANIFPLISGNVQDVTVKQGDFVTKGQILGTIRSGEIAGYSAALITAENNLNEAVLRRTEELAQSGLASQIDVTTAKVGFEQARAALTAAQRVMKINGDDSKGEYKIKSPVDGFVVQKTITNGMAIRTDNGNSMFTISDLKDVWVQANVYEANINKVHEGDEVYVTTLTNPDKIYRGVVDRLMNTLDPTNRVMKMRVVLPNPGYELKPQMFANVTVNSATNQQAITVPESALVFDHSQYYVVVYNGPKDVKIRSVNVLSINGSKAYIKSGISLGERVIASQTILIYAALNS